MDKQEVYLSVVVPVFNEQESLNELYSRINKALEEYRDTEIVFVDDGSSDSSLDILKKFSVDDNKVRVVSLYRNFGQHAALMAGFKDSYGKIIVTLDADLQNPPEEIPKLVSKIEDGFDVVAGKRLDRKDRFMRIVVSVIMNKIISVLTGVKHTDYGCMLRAYRRPIINCLLDYGEKSVYIPAFTSWLSSNIIEVPVKHESRAFGVSKYNLLKFCSQSFDLITAYTLLPIQLLSFIGIGFSAIGIFLACYLISVRLYFGTPSPLTIFISALLFFSGIIIFSIGVICEYIVRVYRETRKQPLYIIKEVFSKESEKI
jgi:undecaprenyl-phosphate 4-deoxy-4-formamido-L-arabinose transferase